MTYETHNLSDELTEDLFVFLDESIQFVKQMLEQLTLLRAAVIRRDDKTLEQMLAGISAMGQQRGTMQQRQRQLSEVFAGKLNCRAEDVTVSYLSDFMEAGKKKELKNKQQTLRRITAQLSSEHNATERLLRECMKLNHKLLEGIFGRKYDEPTYSQGGQVQREMRYAMMSLKI